MRDTLDLKLITNRTIQSYKRGRFSRILWVLLMVIIFVFTPLVVIFVIRYPKISYVDQAGTHEAPNLSGYAHDLQVSPMGIVWVSTSNGRILRLVDNVWQTISSPNDIYSFTLADEDVWAASPTIVQHYHNEQWTTYDNVGSGESPRSIVVGGNHVYVLDEEGNLWDFDGSTWQIANVRDFLPSLTDDENDQYSRLAYTSDGSLWLEWHQLWRLRNGRWRSVEIGGTSTRNVAIAGASENILWTDWGNSLLRQNVVSGDYNLFTQNDMGVPADTRFYELATDAKVTWVATTNGILRFDDVSLTWDRYHVPSTPLVYAAAITPNGIGWIASSDGSSPIVAVVILIGLMIALLIVFPLFLISMLRRPKTSRDFDKQAWEALYRTLPDFPQYQPRSRKRSLEYLVILVFSITVIGLTGPLPAREHFIMLPIAVVIIVLLWLTVVWHWQMRTRPTLGDTIHYVLPGLMWLAWVILVQFILLAIVDLKILPQEYVNEAIAVILSLVLIAAVPVALSYLIMAWCYVSPLSKGDYQTALRRMRKMIAWQPKRVVFQRGEVVLLALADQHEEAERKAFECMYNFPYDFSNVHFMLGIIAGIWIDQGRYDDAMPLSEIALLLEIGRLPKGNAGAWATLTENYLKCGDDPARALEITEYAEQCKRDSSTLLGMQAWALATLGLDARTEITLQKAHKKINKRFKRLMVADWHLSVGRVRQNQKRYDESRQNYEQAIKLDGRGHIGRLAQKALNNIS